MKLADLIAATALQGPWRPDPEDFVRSRYPDKRTVPLVQVADYEALTAGPVGAYFWHEHNAGLINFAVKVPYLDWHRGRDGCIHSVPVVTERGAKAQGNWWWNGNRERPTLEPSLLCWTWPPKAQQVGTWEEYRIEAWHGWVRDGVLTSC